MQQLLTQLDHVHQEIEGGSQVDIFYMDFQKAFDSVPHVDLLIKLWALAITGDLWMWFKTYLIGRSQCISINGMSSDHLPVISGVTQGSYALPHLCKQSPTVNITLSSFDVR